MHQRACPILPKWYERPICTLICFCTSSAKKVWCCLLPDSKNSVSSLMQPSWWNSFGVTLQSLVQTNFLKKQQNNQWKTNKIYTKYQITMLGNLKKCKHQWLELTLVTTDGMKVSFVWLNSFFLAPDPPIEAGKSVSGRFIATFISFSQGGECSAGGLDTEHPKRVWPGGAKEPFLPGTERAAGSSGGGFHGKDLGSRVLHLGFNHSVLTLVLCPREHHLVLCLSPSPALKGESCKKWYLRFSNETSENHPPTCGVVRSGLWKSLTKAAL